MVMSKGINRALLSDEYRAVYEHASAQSKNCVFISHKSEDMDVAKNVAELLKNNGIDVYLDSNDSGLQRATREGDAKKIVTCIERALSISTHILVLVTEKTKESWWVPYEIGFSKKGKKSIASLLLKTVSGFPDYLEIEKKIYGLNDLKTYTQELRGSSFYYESASDVYVLKQIEMNLLNYIRG